MSFSQLDDETQSLVTDALLTAQDILASQELQLPRIVQIEVHEMPASVLAYQLYEDDEREIMISNLNEDQELLLMDGTVNVLTLPKGS